MDVGTSDVWADLDGGERGQPFRSHSLFLGKRELFWVSAGIFFQIQMLLYYCVLFCFVFFLKKGGKLKAKFFLLDFGLTASAGVVGRNEVGGSCNPG